MDEMLQHVSKHASTLRGIQNTSTGSYFGVPRPEDRLAPEVEEIWQSTLDHFQMGTYKIMRGSDTVEISADKYDQLIHLYRFT